MPRAGAAGLALAIPLETARVAAMEAIVRKGSARGEGGKRGRGEEELRERERVRKGERKKRKEKKN